MRVLWLTLNSSYSHSSLALPLIHIACGELAEWEHLQATLKDDPAELAARVEAVRPNCLCITLYLFNRNLALEVAGRVRALLPEVAILAGGPECNGEGARAVLQDCPAIDMVLRGEGETALREYLEGRSVPGSVRREGSRIVEDSRPPLPYTDWISAPPPSTDAFFQFDKPFVQIETARGCPNHCRFCTSANTAVRLRPLESVRQELQILSARGVREIRLLDRTFNLPPARAAGLLRMFREEFPEIRFHLELHPAFLSPELREQIASAIPGKLHLEAGIQSLSPAVLNAIGRADTAERAFEGLQFLCSLPNVIVHTDLIAGLPEQTWPSLVSDLQRLLSLAPAEIQLETLKILHGTDFAAKAQALGLAYSPVPPYDVMRTPAMTTAQLSRARLLSRMVDLFYNAAPLAPAFEDAAIIPEFLEAFLDFLIAHGFTTGPGMQLKQRFLWLYEFLQTQPENWHALSKLAIAWLLEAFPFAEGPAKDACLVPEIPENVHFFHGNPADALRQGTRFVMLPALDHSRIFFAYNRAVAPNKAACAAYELP